MRGQEKVGTQWRLHRQAHNIEKLARNGYEEQAIRNGHQACQIASGCQNAASVGHKGQTSGGTRWQRSGAIHESRNAVKIVFLHSLVSELGDTNACRSPSLRQGSQTGRNC